MTITKDQLQDVLEEGIPVKITKEERKPEKSMLLAMIRDGIKISADDFSEKIGVIEEEWCGLSFTGTDAYQKLKKAAEAYVMAECKIAPQLKAVNTVNIYSNANVNTDNKYLDEEKIEALTETLSLNNIGEIGMKWTNYLEDSNGVKALPYLALIKGRLGQPMDENEQECYTEIVNKKLSNPLLMELIWSYWHEEAMLVQAMNAICLRFQNKRSGNRDQLANMNIDPLRPLSNIIWGYIQDEPNRLSVQRRAYEYDYQYGLKLCGKAINLLSVESRSKFISAFNNLLHLCTVFFKQEDDQMVTADGFPILNALKDIQILLTQGMHNQYGDLPSTARVEMLIQQWILGRPEMKEFLGGRTMVPYPEKWMSHLDSIKSIQGWTDVPSVHFYHLANYGEKLLLSIRFGNWSEINDRDEAANWARFWRSEIQGYIYAYKAATGADVTTANAAMNEMPSQLLLKKAA